MTLLWPLVASTLTTLGLLQPWALRFLSCIQISRTQLASITRVHPLTRHVCSTKPGHCIADLDWQTTIQLPDSHTQTVHWPEYEAIQFLNSSQLLKGLVKTKAILLVKLLLHTFRKAWRIRCMKLSVLSYLKCFPSKRNRRIGPGKVAGQ